jgi:hypothetical protein
VATAALLLYGAVVASAGLLAPFHLGLLGLAFGVAACTPWSSANGAMSLGISAVAPAGMVVERLGYPALFALVGGLTSASALLLVPRDRLTPAALRRFRSFVSLWGGLAR